MVEDKILGTYWYCVNKNGSKWLIDGDKPAKSGDGYLGNNNTMFWLEVSSGYGRSHRNGVELRSFNFKDVKFPNRTYEDGPLEIEIVKSGNVYWYDSNTGD